MIHYPHIDPVIVQIGPLAIRWYGLMYLLGFGAGWWLGRRRAREPGSGWTTEQIDDLVFYGALGVILGGRIGYILFYDFASWLDDPLLLLRIWEGGMSFHGGLLGVLVALWLYGRKLGRGFFAITDFVAPVVPPGLGAGRIGNFINGELWGKETDMPWGFVVDGVGRHPSMLYEALLEGLVLFVILWLYSARRPPRMAVSGAFALGYGVFRFAVEFVRVPDQHLGDAGYLAFGWLTMGQVLSAPLILVGILLLALAYGRREPAAA
jgi:phosphatidylglycerol:prolipoprotein diacylglycerol transferase